MESRTRRQLDSYQIIKTESLIIENVSSVCINCYFRVISHQRHNTLSLPGNAMTNPLLFFFFDPTQVHIISAKPYNYTQHKDYGHVRTQIQIVIQFNVGMLTFIGFQK